MKHELESLSHSIGYSPPRSGICHIWGFLASVASSGLSTGFNSILQKKQHDQQREDIFDDRWYERTQELDRRKFQREMLGLEVQAEKDLRDYDNAYNDPSAVRDRFLHAGYSPMAALGQGSFDGSSASAPSSPSVPGANVGHIPQVFNPSASVASLSQSFSDFMRTMIQQKKSVAEIRNLDSQSDRNAAETVTIEALRKGQIDLQGVEIKLKGSQADWTEDDRKRIAAVVEKTKTDIQVAQEYMRYMGVQIDYVSFQKWLQKQDFDVRSKEIASRIALNLQMSSESRYRQANIASDTRFKNMSFDDRMFQVHSQRWRTSQENDVLYDYYKNDYAKKANKRADMLGDYQVKNIPSDLSIAVRQGMATVSSILQPVGQIFSAYSQFAVGNYYTTKRSQMLNSTFQNGNLMTDPVDGGTFWNSQNW